VKFCELTNGQFTSKQIFDLIFVFNFTIQTNVQKINGRMNKHANSHTSEESSVSPLTATQLPLTLQKVHTEIIKLVQIE